MTETSGGPTARALRLLDLLQSRPVWSGTELAERLGVTTRSVRRDVERLRALGYPVNAEHGAAGGYRLGAGRRLPPLLLDDDEAIAVAVCLRLAAGGTVEGLGEAAVRTLAKLDQVLPSRLRAQVDAIHEATVTLDGPGAARRLRDVAPAGPGLPGDRAGRLRVCRAAGSQRAPRRALPARRHRPALVPARVRPRP